ncbi:transcription factor MYB124 isoform X1 [Ricinus communis]|uniref:transcription factor MYB124 isoform X1 n=1 Tax=Ricinus communis TaxID=3988 RepID=UPI0007724189|nr:transcription factor MYB124 isoform X1 [Ricinus communis]|eukprot:XP_015575305.1 transcription factor MYB124 isoform X1 [Ricinus communis]
MQETKKKNSGCNEDSKKKERHIVTWTQQEDDILRQQISLHGTENWAIIASKFKDKTTRQCRRRWYTYLNSDFKKGGWSPEEDLLLCEAQKIFGNRWTEIAKVVSGRTDNAVKNRFTTLCKKRAKYEALAKENKSTYVNSNNKRILFQNGYSADGSPEKAPPAKKTRRSHIIDRTEHYKLANRSHLQGGNQQSRPPFAVLAQNFHNVNVAAQHTAVNAKEVLIDAAENSKIEATFLRKDDPKITALMQQAELLSSLALKVNTENTDQSLENAWKVLQDFLNRSKENDILGYRISDIDFQLEDFKDLIEDLRSSYDGSRPSWRQPDLYEDSPASSDYSTGSTLMPYTAPDKTEQAQAEIGEVHKDIGNELQSVNAEEQNDVDECEKEIIPCASISQGEIFPSFDEQTNNDVVVSASSSSEFSSPLQVTPIFRSLAAGIPSPKFSESERNFLLKTLGVESPCPNQSINPSQPPPCRRALLQSL